MICTAVGFLTLLALLPPLQAQKRAEKQTPAQQYEMLMREAKKARMDFEKDRDISKSNQRFLTLTQRLIALAKNNPQDPVAVDALTWILNLTYDSSDPEGPRAQALTTLLRDHVRSEKMVTVCRVFLGFRSEVGSRKLLQAVLEKNPHRAAKAQACFVLAIHTEEDISEAPELRKNPGDVKKVEVLYERIVKDFGDVPRIIYRRQDEESELKAFRSGTLGEFAKAKLVALRHPIVVGQPAPEIEGMDIEGKKFKLSDHRGKIVLLVFWGNWSGPCTAMYEYERLLVKRLQGKPFVLIGVNTDLDRGELKKLMKDENLTWRSFMDGGSWDGGPISCRWGIKSWPEPTLFLIDDKGVIRHKHEGSPGAKALDADIDKLLGKKRGKKRGRKGEEEKRLSWASRRFSWSISTKRLH